MEVESTLRPQAPGARKYAERFANRLVCVRHRRDDLRARGITTVELVLDERPFSPIPLHWAPRPSPKLLVRIGYGESALRRAVKEPGALWVPQLKLWEVPREQVVQLNLEKRVVTSASPRCGASPAASPSCSLNCSDVGKAQI